MLYVAANEERTNNLVVVFITVVCVLVKVYNLFSAHRFSGQSRSHTSHASSFQSQPKVSTCFE